VIGSRADHLIIQVDKAKFFEQDRLYLWKVEGKKHRAGKMVVIVSKQCYNVLMQSEVIPLELQ